MKKKLALILSLVFLLSTVLVGCGSKESGAGEESSDKKTINFVHWRGEDTEAFNEIIKKFEAANPNIHVEMNVFPSESYQAQIQATLLSGKGADVFATMPGSYFEALQEAGVYADLSNQEILNSFSEGLITAGQADGKQLALPYQLVYNIPVYNKGIFEKLGLEPPTDWNGFLEVCKVLKENGYDPILFSGDISPGQFINPMIMNNQPVDDAFHQVELGNEKLTNDWFVKTLSQIKELNDNGYFQDAALGTKKEGAAALFAQEKGAMLAHGSYMMATVKSQNPEIEQGLLAPITVDESEMKYEGIHTATFMLGVSNKSAYQEEALKFIEFLASPEIAAEYANTTGQLLTVKDVNYDSPELAESGKWLEKKTLFQPRYMITNEQVSKAIQVAIEDVISGVEPKEAAEKAQKEVDRVIK
ncbi:ABC transporter substrate-binding protein [Bacillus taeanensis]|uniref:Sugar ABC transporter substrate-binding protein n=1 Tax=Bacillus taeanensis TaxID=273032 RepID=A0A366XN93_9BACI|nr:extracellular solute-binding protein [Bacillus taeanensis]RBW67377.1 sugar ABC transporter substrate-binding protein [Bacillus taeanensis]